MVLATIGMAWSQKSYVNVVADHIYSSIYQEIYLTGDVPVDIKTHYEMQWLQRGLTIKYIRFALPHGVELVEPDIDIEPDTYRSYNRGYIQMPQLMSDEDNSARR